MGKRSAVGRTAWSARGGLAPLVGVGLLRPDPAVRRGPGGPPHNRSLMLVVRQVQ